MVVASKGAAFMKTQIQPEAKKQHQIFLRYASNDREVAHKIVEKLKEEEIRVWFDEYELQPGDSIAKSIENTISASDYLIVLLSPSSVSSTWMQKELGATLSNDLIFRDITLLPALIADCEIPEFLSSYQYLDLRIDFEDGMNRLVEQIGIIPVIDFSKLDGRSFEELVVDLLDKLGFEEIERQTDSGRFRFDARVSYSYLDPFGVKITETWLVESKFYRNERASLNSIMQFASYLSSCPTSIKGLLITNSHLTSATQTWLKSVKLKEQLSIRVIAGTEFKRLLLQHKDLVNKYFVKNHAAA